jgi:hypothetical protein
MEEKREALEAEGQLLTKCMFEWVVRTTCFSLEFLSKNLEFKSFLDSENMDLKCITIKSRIIF